MLDIGDGKFTKCESGCIKFLNEFYTNIDLLDALIDQIFPNVQRQQSNHEGLSEKSILAAKNQDINKINLMIQNLLSEDLVSYKSTIFILQFFNSLDLPGVPSHNIQSSLDLQLFCLEIRTRYGSRTVHHQSLKNV